MLRACCLDYRTTGSGFKHLLHFSIYCCGEFSFINSKDVLASPDDKQLLRMANSKEREKFFSNHPDLKGKVVLFNSLPLTIINRYPNEFSIKEICDQSNLRVIDRRKFSRTASVLNPDIALKDETLNAIFASWNAF